MAWLDMHLHSSHSSDGQHNPKILMKYCLRDNIYVAAIADHNTTKGLAQGRRQAEIYGITFIPAIELDCTFNGMDLHILGYWINENYPEFIQVEQNILLQEQQAAQKRMELVTELGIHLDKEAIMSKAKQGVVTGEMIAEAALADPQNINNPLLKPYRKGNEKYRNALVNFYWDYCAQGKPAYVPIQYLSLEEAVNLIHDSGGIAILAHPGKNINENAKQLFDIIQMGVDGIEVFSSYHNKSQTAFYLKKATEFGVGISCGSDYHGKTKPKIKIGCVDCNGMEKNYFYDLLKRYEKNGEESIVDE